MKPKYVREPWIKTYRRLEELCKDGTVKSAQKVIDALLPIAEARQLQFGERKMLDYAVERITNRRGAK